MFRIAVWSCLVSCAAGCAGHMPSALENYCWTSAGEPTPALEANADYKLCHPDSINKETHLSSNTRAQRLP
jgi:hypothetical protein